MNGKHTTDHERWYEPIVLGESEGVPTAMRVEIDGCPECSLRLGELRRVRSAAARAGREQQEVLAAARALDDVPGARQADALLLDLASAKADRGEATSRPPPPRRGTGVARAWLAAASLVAIGGLVWLLEPWKAPPPKTIEVLGDSEFTDLTPFGETVAPARFTWRYALDPGGWFVVRVRALDDPARAPVLESPRLEEPLWEPTDAERARLPRRFEWQVSSYDATGGLQRVSPAVLVFGP
jgi:hypothetical protein